jgi:hypothetical protein
MLRFCSPNAQVLPNAPGEVNFPGPIGHASSCVTAGAALLRDGEA